MRPQNMTIRAVDDGIFLRNQFGGLSENPPQSPEALEQNTMRITCNSHCLSKIFAVSPFFNATDLDEAYRRLSMMTPLRSVRCCRKN